VRAARTARSSRTAHRKNTEKNAEKDAERITEQNRTRAPQAQIKFDKRQSRVRQSQTPLQSDLHLYRGRASSRLTDVFAPISFPERNDIRLDLVVDVGTCAPFIPPAKRDHSASIMPITNHTTMNFCESGFASSV
jgi:hypothetical protein